LVPVCIPCALCLEPNASSVTRNLQPETCNPLQSQVGLADNLVLKEFVSETFSNDLP